MRQSYLWIGEGWGVVGREGGMEGRRGEGGGWREGRREGGWREGRREGGVK